MHTFTAHGCINMYIDNARSLFTPIREEISFQTAQAHDIAPITTNDDQYWKWEQTVFDVVMRRTLVLVVACNKNK
jgi:hypothetical protein